MSLFDAVDTCLLLWTEKVVQRFGWLTGRDNFFLARVVNNCGFGICVGYMVCSFMTRYPAAATTIIGGVMFLVLERIRYNGNSFVTIVELIKEHEAELGAKFIEFEMWLCGQRKKSLLLLVCGWSMLFVFSGFSFERVFYDAWLYAIGPIGIALAYIVSVDRPPYKRSRLRRMARFLFKKLVRKVVPEPEPEALPVPSS